MRRRAEVTLHYMYPTHNQGKNSFSQNFNSSSTFVLIQQHRYTCMLAKQHVCNFTFNTQLTIFSDSNSYFVFSYDLFPMCFFAELKPSPPMTPGEQYTSCSTTIAFIKQSYVRSRFISRLGLTVTNDESHLYHLFDTITTLLSPPLLLL